MKKFEKKVEDFTCFNCGSFVKGNGYTDHCPSCLASKHIDINPGDRSSNCNGYMMPFRTEYKNSTFTIYYKCKKCNLIK
ncbi:MAG: RNHCP domain-containing protein, partial [Candidatus Micrarchaeia archaeon]